MIVDTGVSTYDAGAERHYERSTAAHNTLRVDGLDQAEIWASFRVGRGPRVGRTESGEVEGLHFVRGEHYGYQRLGAVHSRTVIHGPEGLWAIADVLHGKGNHKVESFMHFHPEVSIESCQAGGLCHPPVSSRWVMSFASHVYQLVFIGGSNAKLENTWYAPEFGLRQSRFTLWQTWEGQLPMSIVCVILPAGKSLPEIRLASDFGVMEIGRILIPPIKAGD